MRYLLVMLLAAILLITACTKPVDEEIEDINEQATEEQVEENIDEQEPTEEEANNDDEKKEKPKEDQEKNNGSNDKVTKDQDNQKDNQGSTEPKDNQQNQTDRDPNELLTEQEAIAKVKSYLQLQFEPDVHVVVDHEENGRYLVHVYEVIPGNNGVGHTSTRGWYYVDRKTGEIESMF
ncbi:hypothetical protein [Alkalihalobacterium chitinilyticum]|uniref:PepSY domain-containing protein n=1 Tax=Alkalihalobacterium chitinilyticum TaxID=2980103 RepID=A0ABT5VK41_9BACI|nr:hypothetical protein [Alkalihalobacterium chitinilyticum]MDE5415806.1 hypothetical protein [Alkalihalobacterium chitinilyticum]